MKGPALWLKHYLRCRTCLNHMQWFVLLALASRHGDWMYHKDLQRLKGTDQKYDRSAVKAALKQLSKAGLVIVDPTTTRRQLDRARNPLPA